MVLLYFSNFISYLSSLCLSCSRHRPPCCSMNKLSMLFLMVFELALFYRPYPCLSPSIMSSLHSVLHFQWNVLWSLNIKLQTTPIPDTPYPAYLLYFSLWYLPSNMIIIYAFKIMSSLPGCKSHKSTHFFLFCFIHCCIPSICRLSPGT